MLALYNNPIKEREKLTCCCGTKFINSESKVLNKKVHNNNLSSGIRSSEKLLEGIASGLILSGCAMLIPKHIFLEIGYFDEKMRYIQDMDM